MDRQVFRVVAFRRNGTENRVKQMAHFVPNRCRSILRVWACTLAYDSFRFVSWPVAPSSSWGFSVRSRTTLHSGAKAGPTPPSTARFLFLYLRGVGAGGALAPSD